MFINKIKFCIISLFLCGWIHAQVPADFLLAKEFSKEISIYKAKAYLVSDILGVPGVSLKFKVDPLAATNSGEITTLYYNCDSQEKEGLILGFYGDYWNEYGIVYKGYRFKNFTSNDAIELLKKISDVLENDKEYLNDDYDNHNICFSYNDLDFLIYKSSDFGYMIRVFWENFDSEWTSNAFKRTKKRFEKRL